MLVLSRKTGESILIGDDIEVVVLQTTQTSARVGISAPANVKILRQELRTQEVSFCENEGDMQSEQETTRAASR